MSAGWRLLLVTHSRRASALMLVGNDRAVATAQAIYAASKSEAFGFEVERMPFAFLFASDLDVKSSSGIDARICQPDHFDVLKIEQPLAIGERVECMNSQ